MKMIKPIALTLALVSVAFTSCEDVDSPSNELRPIELSRGEADVAKQNCDFAWDMFSHVNKTSGNAIVSPLSATYALCMAAEGANGTTRDEIYQALGFENCNNEDVNNYLHKLTTQLTSLDSKTTLHIANSLWHNKEYLFLNEYITNLKTYYNADVKPLGTNAVKEINNWCSKKTNGYIKNILQPNDITSLTASVLVNALYFNSEWKDKFNKDNTFKALFYSYNDNTQVEYMSGSKYSNYVIAETFTMASLKLGNCAYSVSFILPNTNNTFDECINEIKTKGWNEISNNYQSAKIHFNIPKFILEKNLDLKDVFNKMGIKQAFSNADFSNMTEKYENLIIYQSVQSNCFKIDEDGATAASISSNLMIGEGSPIPPFILNRPFLFALTEQSTGTILFVGKIETL